MLRYGCLHLLVCLLGLLVLLKPTKAQFIVENIPMNDAVVMVGNELYCRIAYLNGTLVNTEWYIEQGVLLGGEEGIELGLEFQLGPPPENTNLTITSLGVVDGPLPPLWCSPEGSPNMRLANFTVAEDSNECQLGSHNCAENATCMNTLGSFNCTCNAGFTGDGTTEGLGCQDVNECTMGQAGCGSNTECVNQIGTFQCVCLPGYSGNPMTECLFDGIVIGFDVPTPLNVSEGVSAVVCFRAFSVRAAFEGTLLIPVVVVLGSASGTMDFNSSAVPSRLVVEPFDELPTCFGIPILEDSISEGIEDFSLRLLLPVEELPFSLLLSPNVLEIHISDTCIDGEVRLRGGFDEFQGRVEICYNGEWGTVCDDSWGNADAIVVCRQLGYEVLTLENGVVAYSNAFFREGEGPILLDDVQCDGGEPGLSSCNHRGFGVENCAHSDDAGVDCRGNRQFGEPCSPDGDVRLVDGQDEFQGRVEFCYSGVWGTVCDNGWDDNDATVVCRQLGYVNSSVRVFRGVDGEVMLGTSSIVLADVNCVGTEPALINCSLPSFFQNTCGRAEDIGVDCLGRRPGEFCTTFDGDVRLVDGLDESQGRVEICFDGVWGTVCDDGWGDNEARVVCRQLRLSLANPVGYRNFVFGPGGGEIVLEGVDCIGNESRLVNCARPPVFENICLHFEDAGVDCIPPVIGFEGDLSPSVREGSDIQICVALFSGMIRSSLSIRVQDFFPEGDFVDLPNEVDGVLPILPLPVARSDDFTIEDPMLTLTPAKLRDCVNVSITNDFDQESSERLPLSVSCTGNERCSVSREAPELFIIIVDDDLNCTSQESLCVDLETFTTTCVSGICDGILDCIDASDELDCPETGVLDKGLNRILEEPLTNVSYQELTEDLSQTVEAAVGNMNDQNSENLGDIAQYVGELATFVNESEVEIAPEAVMSLVGTLSSLLSWNEEVLVNENSSAIVDSFEVVAAIFAQQIEVGTNQTVETINVLFLAENTPLDTLQETGRSFSFSEGTGIIGIELGDEQLVTEELGPREVAAITLPSSLFQGITDNRTNVGVFFAVYSVSSLFPVTQDPANENNTRKTVVGSRVLASTVGPGLEFTDLAENVSIVLRLVNNMTRDEGSVMCVTWSFLLNDWTTEGCGEPVQSPDRDVFTCSCNHLTNFALLVDICTRVEDCERNPIIDKVLSFITYIGASISMVCLVITIITLIFFKKLRQRDASKYHIQLSIAIFCMLLVFVVGVERTKNYGGCVTVSVLIHYFTLVAVMWMGAEALLMFQKLVIVFVQITTKYIVAVSLVCWLVPLVPVLIPLIVDLATGNDPNDDIVVMRDQFCFLSHIGAFFGAFLALIFIVIIFNLVIFIIVIVVLVRHTRGQLSRQQERMKPGTAIRLMISITGVMFLFGLSWLFAALTITVPGVRYAFQILFTLFTAFQGFFIFLFFCLLNREAREFWKEVLSCGKYRSDLLHPSKYKASSTGPGGNKHVKSGTASTGIASLGKSSKAYNSEIANESLDLKKEEHHTEITLSKEEEAAELEVATVVETNIDEKAPSELVDLHAAQDTSTTGTEGAEKQRDESPKKKKSGLSLKARIKRYSTKKTSKHHVESVEVDLHSVDSSDSDAEDATAENVASM